MLKAIINFHIDHPWVVLFGLLVLIAAGVNAMLGIPVDAFPDLTNNQVVVVTDDAALAREDAMIPALRFVPEGDASGLDAAVAAGVAALDPAGRMPRAALLGDLPALRPDDLAEAKRWLRTLEP